MKVLQVHDQPFDSGGIAVYLRQISEGLRQREWEVEELVFSANPKSVAELPKRQVMPASSHVPRPAVLRAIPKLIEQIDPDIIHLHSTYYALHPLALNALLRQRPVIYTLHDVTPICLRHNKLHRDGSLCIDPVGARCVTSGCYHIGERAGALLDIVRVLMTPLHLREYRRLPRILVPSAYLGEQLIINGFAGSRITVLPLFSRFNSCNGDSRANTEKPRILFVGRLVKDKGILDLLDALAQLTHLDWEALIVGGGELAPVARQTVNDHGMQDRVRFVEKADADHLAEHYRNCDFVVFPSLIPESFGLVGIEAFSFGKPVVGYHSGGVGEWLQHGVTGLMAEHGNVEDLARQIERMILDQRLRQRLGQAGQEAARSRFTFEAHIHRLIELYEQTIGQFAEVYA